MRLWCRTASLLRARTVPRKEVQKGMEALVVIVLSYKRVWLENGFAIKDNFVHSKASTTGFSRGVRPKFKDPATEDFQS